MKNYHVLLLALLASAIMASKTYSQTSQESFVLGELIFKVKNPPSQYSVDVSVSNVGMLFSGDSDVSCPQPRVYSHTYSDLDPNLACAVDVTQFITGASREFTNTTKVEWDIEHVGDAAPKKLDQDGWNFEWIGYGVYKIEVEGPDGFYTFYIDYLDSNYPSEKNGSGNRIYPNVDIHVDYDFNQQAGQRVRLWTNQASFTNVNGNLFTVWDDLFNPSQARATAFYLHGTVPLSSLSSDKLFSSVIVDGDITVPSGKSFMIEPDLYPGEQPPNLALKFAAQGVDMWVKNGAQITAIGTFSNPITFTSASSTPGRSSWGTIFVESSNNSFEYCTVEYSDWGVKIYDPIYLTGNVVKNCTFKDNDQGLRMQNADVAVDNNTIRNNRHGMVAILADAIFTGNSIYNNDRDGVYSITGTLDFFSNTINNNGLGQSSTIHGIYAQSGSDVNVGGAFGDPTPGNNRIDSNKGSGRSCFRQLDRVHGAQHRLRRFQFGVR